MKRESLKNFEHYVEPEIILFEQEVDVIVALVLRAIKLTKCNISYGTFILDGQKKDGEAQCLIRFDLPKGHLRSMTYIDYNFALMAEDAINDILRSPEWQTSSIYIANESKVLVLNTTYGRFLCSFYADFLGGGHSESTNILMVVAEAIAQMGKEDTILQDSVSAIWFAEIEDNGGANTAMLFVRDAFEKCEIPELAKWKEWHIANNDNLALFFE